MPSGAVRWISTSSGDTCWNKCASTPSLFSSLGWSALNPLGARISGLTQAYYSSSIAHEGYLLCVIAQQRFEQHARDDEVEGLCVRGMLLLTQLQQCDQVGARELFLHRTDRIGLPLGDRVGAQLFFWSLFKDIGVHYSAHGLQGA